MFIKDSNTDDKEFRLIGDLFDFAFLRESLRQMLNKDKTYLNILSLLDRGLTYTIQNKIKVNSKIINIDLKDLKEKDYNNNYISYYSLSIPCYLAFYIALALDKTIPLIKEDDITYSFESLTTPSKSYIFSVYQYIEKFIGKQKADKLFKSKVDLKNLEESKLLEDGNVEKLFKTLTGESK